MLISLAHQDITIKEQLFDAKYLDCGGHKVLSTYIMSPIHLPAPALNHVQFSLHCTKYDRHGYKARQRIIVITEKVSDGLMEMVGHPPNHHTKGCYLLEPGSFKVKESFNFRDITGIFVSSLSDGVVVIKLQPDTQNRVSYHVLYMYGIEHMSF